MNRSTAREIAVRLSYELSFTDMKADMLLDQTLTEEYFQGLAQEDSLYSEVPDEKQASRICTNWRERSQEIYSFIIKKLTE